jgi:outer membrane lipoprotein SlyB
MEVNMKRIVRVAAALAVTVLAGCAPSQSGSVYSRDKVGQEQTVRTGVVDSVRQVQIEGTRSGVGPAAGAVVGGIAGSTIGHGKGSAVGAVLGSVVGGVAGQAAEQGTTRRNGVEITVRLDSGGVVAITQEADATTFNSGDRVRLLSGGGVTRVARY